MDIASIVLKCILLPFSYVMDIVKDVFQLALLITVVGIETINHDWLSFPSVVSLISQMLF